MKPTHTIASLLFSFILFCPLTNFSKNAPSQNGERNWRALAVHDVEKLPLQKIMSRSLSDDEYAHLLWVAKVSRLLRGGRELGKGDDIAALLKLSREQIVDQFLNADTFYDSVLDFNFYYLGFRLNYIVDDGKYNPNIFDNRAASTAAVMQAGGMGYEALLDFYPVPVVQPLNPVPSYFAEAVGVEMSYFLQASTLVQRQMVLKAIIDGVEALDARVKAKTMTVSDACSAAQEKNYVLVLYYIGPSSGLANYLARAIEPDFYGQCLSPVPIEPENFTAFQILVDFLKDVQPKLDAFDPSVYHPTRLTEFKTWPEPPGSQKALVFQDFQFSDSLVNSSTNFSRRRSAYFLKRFFCDDLTPINVEIPADHTEGKHGSEASCYACHYKLDPMAGFFKNYGSVFSDFSDSDEIIFDDGARMNLQQYQANWLAPAGSAHKWNIGYIRSEKDAKLNSYGESLEDLTNIIKNSHEFKRCVVQRAFQYATDGSQMMDPGFIEAVSNEFQSEADGNRALKQLFRKVALSKTFAEEDREPNVCYDTDPQAVPGTTSPPCQVSFILKTNCVKCHDANMSLNDLDLESWIQLEDGSFGFPHLDENGKQLSRQDSFARILDRITTADPKKRMPLKSHMDPAHREKLYKWLHEEGI